MWYDDPYAKFRRAGYYLRDLYKNVGAFLKRDVYEVLPQLDEDGWHRLRFRVIEKPPEDLALLVGDFVQNLRASLDHSVYALATKRSDRTEYPIKSQEDQYLGSNDPSNPIQSSREIALANVPDEYRTVIDASQPYHRGNAARDDPLAVLAWLSNVDKHRLIHPAFHRQHGLPEIRITRGRLGDVKIRRDIPVDQAASDDTVVAAWRPKPGKERDVDMDIYISFTVAFSERALDYVDLEGIWNYTGRVINTLRAVSEGRDVALDTAMPVLTRPSNRARFERGFERRVVRRPFGGN